MAGVWRGAKPCQKFRAALALTPAVLNTIRISFADVTVAGTLTPVRALQLTRPPCISDAADADIVVSGPDGDRAPYLSRV